jgi:hypothetical protein
MAQADNIWPFKAEVAVWSQLSSGGISDAQIGRQTDFSVSNSAFLRHLPFLQFSIPVRLLINATRSWQLAASLKDTFIQIISPYFVSLHILANNSVFN